MLKGLDRKLDRVIEMLGSSVPKEDSIMATQAELARQLTDLKTQVTKIGAETTVLLQKVADLEKAVVTAGNVTPEVQAALDALKTTAQGVDDLVPDVPPGP